MAPMATERGWRHRYFEEGAGHAEEVATATPTHRHLLIENLLKVDDVLEMSEGERRDFVSALKRKLDSILEGKCSTLVLPLPRKLPSYGDGDGAVCLASFESVAVAEKAREKFAALSDVGVHNIDENEYNALNDRKGSVVWTGLFYKTSSGPSATTSQVRLHFSHSQSPFAPLNN